MQYEIWPLPSAVLCICIPYLIFNLYSLHFTMSSYAYWLGFIYRCECLLHEESSRMVYGAFSERIMRRAYRELLKTELGRRDYLQPISLL